ncbi:MAG: hypothetical protein K1Y36_26730, partial [Blastocatellia bacterium]|nr:hypothetical protein [Blastocatellia bacterium]
MKRLVVAGVVQVLVLLVSCWVTPPALWALDPRKAINAYHLQSWQEGLPHPSVNALVQTPDGYLWLSTFEGLVRFNGVEFTVFNPGNTPALTSNGARPLFVGHDGTLWIGLTGGGLAGCKDGRFFRIPAIDTTIRGRISALYEDRAGRLWIGAQMGLGCFEKGVCRLYTKQDGLPTNDILSLCEDAHGDIWIGLQSVPKVCRFSAGRMEAIPVGKETSSAVLAILPDRANRLWLGTVGDGLYCVENGVQTKIPDPQGIINDVVTTLLEDKDGNIWIGTGGNGLVRMTNGILTTFTSQEGLPSNLIRSLGEDREGNLWVGTEGGLCRLRDGKLAVISVRAGLPSNDIRGILQDRQGRLWVGSIGGGLSCYQNGTWTHYTTKNGLARNSVRALCEDREGGIWIGFDGGGLCRFINGSLTRFDRAALPNSSSIRSMTLGADGRMWFGTYGGGLTCYQNGSFTHYGQAEGLGSDVVQGLITAHDGTVWMSSQGAGVTCLRNGKFSVYGEKDGLSSLFTWGFYEDAEHTLWIGTNTGLTCYQNGRFFPLRDETSQGIFNTTIGNILEDAHGFLWLVTAKGIAKVEKAQLHQFREGKIRSLKEIPVELFGRAEGAAGDQCNTTAFPAGWKTQEGKLWIPSINGI